MASALGASAMVKPSVVIAMDRAPPTAAYWKPA